MMWRRSFITARSIAMKMATNVYVMLANRVSCSDYSGGTVLMSVRLCLFSRRSALCGDAGFKKSGNQPNQPLQQKQENPSGQPKSPQSEQCRQRVVESQLSVRVDFGCLALNGCRLVRLDS
jgi:hypothetical protein